MARQAVLLDLLLLSAGLTAVSPVWGQQRIRLPQATTTWESAAQNQGGTSPGSTLVPVPSTAGPSYSAPPSATLGAPTFDPYSTSPNAASTPPSLVAPPGFAPGSGSSTSPLWQLPGAAPSSPTPYMFPNTGYPPPVFPQQPPVLFPYGLGNAGSSVNWPQPEPGRYLRLFQDVRLSDTWLYGGDSTSTMRTHDVEVGTTVNFPNFFFSGRPLHVSPGFVFHLWDGPDSVKIKDAPPVFHPDLPAIVYSAFLDFRWNPMITPQLGGDLDVNVGVFSDFGTVTMDSLRLQGTGLLVLNLTPTFSLKAGATYLDRVDIKLLPAAGVLWIPNPQTRFDIYFPKPKLSQYLTTIGNTDIWWYLTAEYGGGSWTVERAPGDHRMDINDIRVGGGLEWTHQCGLNAFFEVAYVFDREIVFTSETAGVRGSDRYSLDDTFMLRGGLRY